MFWAIILPGLGGLATTATTRTSLRTLRLARTVTAQAMPINKSGPEDSESTWPCGHLLNSGCWITVLVSSLNCPSNLFCRFPKFYIGLFNENLQEGGMMAATRNHQNQTPTSGLHPAAAVLPKPRSGIKSGSSGQQNPSNVIPFLGCLLTFLYYDT